MKNNFKGIFIGVIIASLIFVGYLNLESIKSIFQSKAKINVASFLTMMKIENPTENDLKNIIDILNTNYVTMVSQSSYYKIETWYIDKVEKDPMDMKKTKVYIIGNTKNAFGAELKRNPIFVVDENNKIIDSYNFIAHKKFSDLPKSDMDIFNLIKSLKESVKIEKWSWKSDYSTYSPGRVKGKATIYNGSEVAVKFVKLKITYFDSKGKVVNTDDTYAIGSDDLLPGQRRIVEWSTYNCEDAKKANVVLDFN